MSDEPGITCPNPSCPDPDGTITSVGGDRFECDTCSHRFTVEPRREPEPEPGFRGGRRPPAGASDPSDQVRVIRHAAAVSVAHVVRGVVVQLATALGHQHRHIDAWVKLDDAGLLQVFEQLVAEVAELRARAGAR